MKKLLERLLDNQTKLHLCQRRHLTWRDRRVRYEKALGQCKYTEAGRVRRLNRRIAKTKRRMAFWTGRIKLYNARINNLGMKVIQRKKLLDRWHKTHGVYMEGPNRVRGGTPSQRLHYAIHKAAGNYLEGVQPGYYAMYGGPRDYAHGLRNYPAGRVWDCSTFADAMYYVCGLPSPSGPGAYENGGFTGTELAHGRQVSQADALPGDLIIFLMYPGDRTGHHVEVVDDPKAGTTIGHGSPPIDASTFGMFGNSLYEIRRYY